ncbi:DUF6807 family protein [Brachybacterium sp. DNPG3]
MSPRGSGGPTITQVAEAAGVSRATVSRVLNGRTSVDPSIGERVREAAQRLDYRPNMTARNLSIGRTLTVALVVPDLGNPLFQTILRGVAKAAEADGYSVLVAEAGDPEHEARIARDARQRCDAVVLVSPRMSEEDLNVLVPQVAPVIVVNRASAIPGVATVGVDYARGIQQLAEHLLSYGHRDFLYVAGPAGSVANHARIAALGAIREANPDMQVRTLAAGSTMRAGYDIAPEVLESGATAVLAFNDLLAFGILARLNEFGVSVPRDLSVTGVDDIELARFAVPSLTTVGQGGTDIGAVTWSLLHQRIVRGRTPRGTAGAASAVGTITSSGTGSSGAGSSGAVASGALLAADPQDSVLVAPTLVIGDSTGRVPPSRIPMAPASSPSSPSAPPTGTGVRPLGWVKEGADWTLLHGGELLAAAVSGASMAPLHSPRPHLHPVRSLQGRAMTVTNPLDHRHHFGVSLTVSDVNGTTYWGGRTYIEGRGSTLLNNHGRQEVQAIDAVGDGHELRSDVRWLSHEGSELLRESRRQSAFVLPGREGWGLSWSSRLHADEEDVRITSPAVRGRMGAGYGGLFWRLPSTDEARIVVPGGTGEGAAHGSEHPFVILQRRHGDDWSSLVLIQDTAAQGRIDPWFVRSTDYVGAATSLAWSQPLDIPRGTWVDVAVTALVLDRAIEADEMQELLAALPAVPAPGMGA